MIERQVTGSDKDADGDITKLCNPNQYWSPCSKSDAIADIEGGTISYYVGSGRSKAYVQVVNDPVKGKYLRTTADSSSSNNLDNLPDC